MDKLKLFVVGESSPDPETWGHGDRAYVIAESAVQAVNMVAVSNEVAEITLDKPMVVDYVFVPENL